MLNINNIWKINTLFSKNRLAPLSALENAVVETQLSNALFDEENQTLTVLDFRSREAKHFVKELRLILEVSLRSC